MKLHANNDPHILRITRYDATSITVGTTLHRQNLLVLPDRVEANWTAHDFAHLDRTDFARLAGCGAEIVLLGTGGRQRFPATALLQPLLAAGIGFEAMDTGAACRTYNLLADEGRKVAAALLIGA
jgi:uncharacterized protein